MRTSATKSPIVLCSVIAVEILRMLIAVNELLDYHSGRIVSRSCLLGILDGRTAGGCRNFGTGFGKGPQNTPVEWRFDPRSRTGNKWQGIFSTTCKKKQTVE